MYRSRCGETAGVAHAIRRTWTPGSGETAAGEGEAHMVMEDGGTVETRDEGCSEDVVEQEKNEG
jgi:hypothetical protein